MTSIHGYPQHDFCKISTTETKYIQVKIYITCPHCLLAIDHLQHTVPRENLDFALTLDN